MSDPPYTQPAQSKFSPHYYAAGRSCGATHAELVTAYRAGMSFWFYAAERRQGRKHDDIIVRFGVQNFDARRTAP